MRKFKVLIVIFSIFLLTGCWNYVELNDMAIANMVAISKTEDDKVEIHIQIIDVNKSSSESSTSGQESPVIYRSTGNTTQEALRKVILESPKKLYFAHMQILVLDEKVAKEGVNNLVDIFMTNSESQKSFSVIIAKDTEAENLLKILLPIEKISGTNISSSIEKSTMYVGAISNVTFDDFISLYLKDGIEIAIPAVSIVNTNNMSESDTDNQEALSSFPDKTLKLTNTALFKEDKLIGYIGEKDSLGYNLITNNVENSVISFPCGDEYASIEIYSPKTDIKIDKNLKVKLTTEVTGTFSEVNCDIDISKKKVMNKLKEAAEKEIESIINESVENIQKQGSDIFGFGKTLYQNNYKLWKKYSDDWENKFKKLEVISKVNLNVEFKNSTSNTIEEEK